MRKNRLHNILLGITLSLACVTTMTIGHAAPQQMINLGQSQTLNPMDTQFMTKAAQTNMAEVQMGRLALKNSKNPQIKSLANRLIQDHMRANADLMAVAKGLNVQLPQQLSDAQQKQYSELSKLHEDSFDKAFLNQMYQDHTAAIAMFDQESRFGNKPELKRYAATTLPTLRNHEQQISGLGKSMNIVFTPMPKEVPAGFMPHKR